MGSQYIPPPEQNVVNVGDEISVNALNGIAQANPAITSTNPVATNNSVATAVSGKANAVHSHVIGDVTNLQTTLDGKANLAGATFTNAVTYSRPNEGTVSLSFHSDSSLMSLTTFDQNGSQSGGATGQFNYLRGGRIYSQVWTNGVPDVETEVYPVTTAGTNCTFNNTNVFFSGTYVQFTNGCDLSFNPGSNVNGNQSSAWFRRITAGPASSSVSGVAVAGQASLNIGVGGTDTASTTAGDVWIATNGTVFNFRDGTGAWRKLTPDNVPNAIDVNSVNPALRLTQRGTGHVILIEDTNNPDTSAFWVNADGKVHIGFDPATFTIEANSKVAVDGGVQLASQATINHGRPFTDYNMEMRVVINGQTCYIPYRIA